MDGWMNGWLNGWMDEWVVELMDDGLLHDGWMDG